MTPDAITGDAELRELALAGLRAGQTATQIQTQARCSYSRMVAALVSLAAEGLVDKDGARWVAIEPEPEPAPRHQRVHVARNVSAHDERVAAQIVDCLRVAPKSPVRVRGHVERKLGAVVPIGTIVHVAKHVIGIDVHARTWKLPAHENEKSA